MQLNAVSSQVHLYYQTNPSALTVTPDQTAAGPAEPTPAETLGEDTLTQVARVVGHGAGGGLASYRLGGTMATQMKDTYLKFKAGGLHGAMDSFKNVSLTAMKGAGLSALVSGGVSAVSNGYRVVKGETDSGTAMTNVIGDTFSGAMGGLGAVSLAGAGHLIFTRMGMVGLPLTIATTALGAAGGAMAGQMTNMMKNSTQEDAE